RSDANRAGTSAHDSHYTPSDFRTGRRLLLFRDDRYAHRGSHGREKRQNRPESLRRVQKDFRGHSAAGKSILLLKPAFRPGRHENPAAGDEFERPNAFAVQGFRAI